jgi:hypothetical protein
MAWLHAFGFVSYKELYQSDFAQGYLPIFIHHLALIAALLFARSERPLFLKIYVLIFSLETIFDALIFNGPLYKFLNLSAFPRLTDLIFVSCVLLGDWRVFYLLFSSFPLVRGSMPVKEAWKAGIRAAIWMLLVPFLATRTDYVLRKQCTSSLDLPSISTCLLLLLLLLLLLEYSHDKR